MLVLTIKEHQRVFIGDTTVMLVALGSGKIRLGIDAPKRVPVIREGLPEEARAAIVERAKTL